MGKIIFEKVMEAGRMDEDYVLYIAQKVKECREVDFVCAISNFHSMHQFNCRVKYPDKLVLFESGKLSKTVINGSTTEVALTNTKQARKYDDKRDKMDNFILREFCIEARNAQREWDDKFHEDKKMLIIKPAMMKREPNLMSEDELGGLD